MGRNEQLRNAWPFINIYPGLADGTPDRIKAAGRLVADLAADLPPSIPIASLHRAGSRRHGGLGDGDAITRDIRGHRPHLRRRPHTRRFAAPPFPAAQLDHCHRYSNDRATTDSNRRMAQALSAAKLDVQLNLVNDVGHDLWKNYYADPRFYQALLQHRRHSAGAATTTLSQAPRAAGHYRMLFTAKVGDQWIDLPYALYLPRGYEKGADRFPAILYLHDLSERGNGLGWIFNAGIEAALASNFRPDVFPVDRSVLTGLVSEEEFREMRPAMFERLAPGDLDGLRATAPGPAGLWLVTVAGYMALVVGLMLLVGMIVAGLGGDAVGEARRRLRNGFARRRRSQPGNRQPDWQVASRRANMRGRKQTRRPCATRLPSRLRFRMCGQNGKSCFRKGYCAH